MSLFLHLQCIEHEELVLLVLLLHSNYFNFDNNYDLAVCLTHYSYTDAKQFIN